MADNGFTRGRTNERDEAAIKEEVVRPWLFGFAPTVRFLDEVLLVLFYETETKRSPVIRNQVQKKPAAPRQPT
jgi:hypothetical protein